MDVNLRLLLHTCISNSFYVIHTSLAPYPFIPAYLILSSPKWDDVFGTDTALLILYNTR